MANHTISGTRRLIVQLITGTPMSRLMLLDKIGTTKTNIADIVRRMHKAGEIHIHSWHREHGEVGRYMPHFLLGQGKDARKPKNHSEAEYRRKWRNNLVERYGENAWKIYMSRARGGAETLVIDGKVVYQRAKQIHMVGGLPAGMRGEMVAGASKAVPDCLPCQTIGRETRQTTETENA